MLGGLTDQQVSVPVDADQKLHRALDEEMEPPGLIVLPYDGGAGLQEARLGAGRDPLLHVRGKSPKERDARNDVDRHHRGPILALGNTRMRQTFKPTITRPGDFDDFWARTRQALEALDLEIAREAPPDEEREPGLRLEWLRFPSFGDVRIHGYVLRWLDGRRRPTVVHSHGYGSQVEVMWAWGRAGLNVVGVDIRGSGRSRDALPDVSRWGRLLTGIDAPEHHFLRGAVCDYMQAVLVAQRLLGEATSRWVIHGISFAGGLALMAEALLHRADLLAVGVPTFGWTEGRHFFVKSGSGREINDYIAARPDRAEDVMVVLRYFDAATFAPWVRCPTLVGLGRSDDVVPPETVYAIANHLRARHEIMEFPVSHTESPDEQHWEAFERYWIDLALTGVPDDFASTGGRRIHPF